MAASSTVWQNEFTPNPSGKRRAGKDLGQLVRLMARERVRHPLAEGEARLTRLEILARVLWTRAAVDGDITALKLLVECLVDQAGAGERGIVLNADLFARAEQEALAHRERLLGAAAAANPAGHVEPPRADGAGETGAAAEHGE